MNITKIRKYEDTNYFFFNLIFFLFKKLISFDFQKTLAIWYCNELHFVSIFFKKDIFQKSENVSILKFEELYYIEFAESFKLCSLLSNIGLNYYRID